ncbi:hypothetical protein GCM10027418_16630 [Mariniluteicoccus endophyticus]
MSDTPRRAAAPWDDQISSPAPDAPRHAADVRDELEPAPARGLGFLDDALVRDSWPTESWDPPRPHHVATDDLGTGADDDWEDLVPARGLGFLDDEGDVDEGYADREDLHQSETPTETLPLVPSVEDHEDDEDDAPHPARGLGFLDPDEATDEPTHAERAYAENTYDENAYDEPVYAETEVDPDHAEAHELEPAEQHVAAYIWSPVTAAIWDDVWADDPNRVPALEPPRARWRPRLSLVTAAVATMVVAAIPAAAGMMSSPPGEAAAIAPPLSLPVPAVTPTASPTPTPRPTVEAPPAPMVQPEAVLPPVKEPGAVTGIPRPCSVDLPFPTSGSLSTHVDRMEKQWNLELTGPQWRDDSYRPVVKIFSETMDAVDCTDYLKRVQSGHGGRLEVDSGSTRSWAWGDYGLTRTHVLTLDFAKFRQGYAEGDRGRLVRLIIHEMAHALNADRDGEPAYWQRFHGVWQANGRPTAYGSTETEAFADAIGYYVARCAADNPYADPKKKPYYDYVKANIFGGREFGGPVATRQVCDGEGR